MSYKLQKQYRLKDYDYSSDGFYFVTICTEDREEYFGRIKNYKTWLSQMGQIAQKYWLEIPDHFPFVKLDEFVVMPNHIHGIIVIDNSVGTQNFAFLQIENEYQNKFGPQSKNLSSIIRGFKIGVTKYAKNNNIYFAWQSRFHDHIIRNEQELNRIRHYIILNPEKWETDRNNPDNFDVHLAFC